MSEQLRCIMDFNFRPMRYIHDSWLSDMPGGELIQRLRTCKRTEHRLSRYVLMHFNIADHYVFDLPEFSEKLALMSAEDLTKFAYYLGVIVYADRLRHSIDGNEVREIKHYLDEDVYLFGLRRAPFVAQMRVIPKFIFPDDIGLVDRILLSGLQCIRMVLRSSGQSVVTRTMLKLPKTWSEKLNIRISKVSAESVGAFTNEIYQEVIQL